MGQGPVNLHNGEAQPMGDGLFVVMQRDEYGKAHSVALSAEDIRLLLGRLEAEG